VLAIGLTGGIGAGKSTVADLLVARGAKLVDADLIARPALAELVFGHPEALADLNAITHPAIGIEMISRKDGYAGTDEIVVLDIPLLRPIHREMLGLAAVVVVDVPTELALERLVTQRGMAATDAEARIGSQADRATRLDGADLVIDNSGDQDRLGAEVDRVWAALAELRDRPPAPDPGGTSG
jgi:dephospho-CoA kinase